MQDKNLKISKKNEFSAESSIIIINELIQNNQDDKLKKYILEIHNADIADILHNLEPEDLCALTVESAAMARVPLAGTNWIPGLDK